MVLNAPSALLCSAAEEVVTRAKATNTDMISFFIFPPCGLVFLEIHLGNRNTNCQTTLIRCSVLFLAKPVEICWKRTRLECSNLLSPEPHLRSGFELTNL